ncbi:glycoside hydrolase family 2 TIM barrel-domain containing protein [Blastococcus haudaquaticus]|uniref:Glycosyl hydrolases family 2, sugar binding domain n=1 Tax=Blastococcus haudaquaticus TaxID=1938745 RepID=A0A286GRJ7_9ACTN|nr:glycoside hydrolase family 2 TIM barrel-domain containing protein [Blastococcus haudaquaticus]SOD98150.1 Glycosyl hydrolases family 2, sugar binding domain [Blastococcus haudaquaticus]
MRRIPFNRGWETRPHANFFAEMHGAAAPWQQVTLPHDAALGSARDSSQGAGTGYVPGGVHEYRAVLDAPEEYRDRRVLLEFEGVYRTAMVYVNGSLAGHRAAGYTGFTVDLDDHLRYGAANEIRVVCRTHRDSRWYSGAGIHRPVHLVVSGLVHIALDGVRVTAVDVDDQFAVVEVATTVEHDGRGLATLELDTQVRDGNGAVVASAVSPVTVLPGEPAIVRQRLLIRDPALWGPDSPSLYTASVVLREGDAEMDLETASFGIRTLSLDPERGLRINGEPVTLRGACVHSDNGVLGAATIGRADERRVELLKAAGFNALRNAHNPMSRAMLDACDRNGVLVMDELTDVWTESKSDFDAALDFPEWWEREVEAMVAKDVNHPSVVFYSIGNEIPEVAKPHGAVWSRRLAEKVRSLDGTRFVTNGINAMLAVIGEATSSENQAAEEQAGINTMLSDMGAFMDELSASELVAARTAEAYDVLDAAGMNYMEARYALDRELFPRRVIVGSETFANRIDRLWRLVLDNPHVIGDFTWTGWDYLGEVGIGRVSFADEPAGGGLNGPYPWLLAHVGDIDITGHRRPASYYREIVFGLRTDPYLAVLRPERSGRELAATPWAWSDTVGSWSWAGAEGKPVTVEVYSDADEVELLLDGASLGTAKAGEANRFRAEFEVVYAPGELTAVARTAGEETGRSTLRSAAGPIGLAAVADRDVVRADDTDLAHVALTLQDGAGVVALGVDREVTVTVEGPGVLQGFGSAAPATEESYLDDVHTTFDGRALAVVRPTGVGVITVTASAPECGAVTTCIAAR